MTKTHFTQTATPANVFSRFMAPTVCGREAFSTQDLSRVTCLNCKRQPEFEAAVTEAGLRAAEAFANQTPTQVRDPWGSSNVTCKHGNGCGNDTFRSNGRSLDHFRYVCAECGETTLVLTETGMSA